MAVQLSGRGAEETSMSDVNQCVHQKSSRLADLLLFCCSDFGVQSDSSFMAVEVYLHKLEPGDKFQDWMQEFDKHLDASSPITNCHDLGVWIVNMNFRHPTLLINRGTLGRK